MRRVAQILLKGFLIFRLPLFRKLIETAFGDLHNHVMQIFLTSLTLRRPKRHVPHALVVPDLAQTVKLRSDHFENSTNVFYGVSIESARFKWRGYFLIVLTKQFTLSRESRKIPWCANSGTSGAWELRADLV